MPYNMAFTYNMAIDGAAIVAVLIKTVSNRQMYAAMLSNRMATTCGAVCSVNELLGNYCRLPAVSSSYVAFDVVV
jgi:hypothetical protein